MIQSLYLLKSWKKNIEITKILHSQTNHLYIVNHYLTHTYHLLFQTWLLWQLGHFLYQQSVNKDENYK